MVKSVKPIKLVKPACINYVRLKKLQFFPFSLPLPFHVANSPWTGVSKNAKGCIEPGPQA